MAQTTIQLSLLDHALLTDDWINSKIYMLHVFLCISQPQGHDGEQRPVAGMTDVCDFFNYVITTLTPQCASFWKNNNWRVSQETIEWKVPTCD